MVFFRFITISTIVAVLCVNNVGSGKQNEWTRSTSFKFTGHAKALLSSKHLNAFQKVSNDCFLKASLLQPDAYDSSFICILVQRLHSYLTLV